MCGLYSPWAVHFSLCLTLVRLVCWLKDPSWKSGQRWLLFALYSWPSWARQNGGFSSWGSTNWQAKSLLSVCCRDKNDFAEQQNNYVTPNDKKPICTVFGTHIHSNKPIKKREVRLNSHPSLLYAFTHPPQTHTPSLPLPGCRLPTLVQHFLCFYSQHFLSPSSSADQQEDWCVCVCLVDWEVFFLVCVDTF